MTSPRERGSPDCVTASSDNSANHIRADFSLQFLDQDFIQLVDDAFFCSFQDFGKIVDPFLDDPACSLVIALAKRSNGKTEIVHGAELDVPRRGRIFELDGSFQRLGRLHHILGILSLARNGRYILHVPNWQPLQLIWSPDWWL